MALCAASFALDGSFTTVIEVICSACETASSRFDLISLTSDFASSVAAFVVSTPLRASISISRNRLKPKKPAIGATTATSVRKTAITASHQSTSFIRSSRSSRRRSLKALRISISTVVSKAVSLGFANGSSCVSTAGKSAFGAAAGMACSTGIGDADSAA